MVESGLIFSLGKVADSIFIILGIINALNINIYIYIIEIMISIMSII